MNSPRLPFRHCTSPHTTSQADRRTDKMKYKKIKEYLTEIQHRLRTTSGNNQGFTPNPWKDERGPSSIRKTLEPFQRQRLGNFRGTGDTFWEKACMGFSERINTILNRTELNWTQAIWTRHVSRFIMMPRYTPVSMTDTHQPPPPRLPLETITYPSWTQKTQTRVFHSDTPNFTLPFQAVRGPGHTDIVSLLGAWWG